jgi:adenylate cyclase
MKPEISTIFRGNQVSAPQGSAMAACKVFRFEGCTLDQFRGSFSRGVDDIDLRPKTFSVLQYLVANAGRLLSKDEILKAVWPGVFVTEDSLVRCVHEARLALGDADGRLIRTVPRRGYLFDAPVIVSEGGAPGVPDPESGPTSSNRSSAIAAAPALADRKRRSFWIASGAAALLLAILTAAVLWPRWTPGPEPDHPSIAVLPFVNMSGDPRQEFYSDAITEDLITGLAHFPNLFVIARNSTFAYKGSPLRDREIGAELGAHYLLEGSVRREQERLRITAQLIDARTEEQLWAKQFNGYARDVALQDEVTQEIAATLASSVRVADVARAAKLPIENSSAYDLVLRAREVSLRTPSPESTREARELAQRAILLDPSFVSAHVQLGRAHYRDFVLEWQGPEALDLAFESTRRAISLDQSSASAYELLGRVHLRRGHHQQAIETLEKAIALNPNMAEGYASLADALTFFGRASEAVPLVEKAMRLDPFYPPQIDMYLGRALYFDKRYEQAKLPLETCVARAPRFRPCYMYLAPVYAEIGRMEDARQAVDKLLEVSPGFAIDRSVRRHLPFAHPVMQFYIGGLRKAGVPE